MLPLKNSHAQKKIPYVNFLIMAGTVLFFALIALRKDPDTFIFKWSVLPALFNPSHTYSYLLAAMALFVQTSWFQLAAGVLFLKIFGDTVEDYLGHLPYLLFYLVGGVVSTLAELAFVRHGNLPLHGAAGAIAAVIGFYLVYEWKSTITTWFPVQGWKKTLAVPVWFYASAWFLTWFLRDLGSVSHIAVRTGTQGLATLGAGLTFGIAVGLLLRPFLNRK